MFERIGGRKFVASTLTVAVGVLVMIFKGDVPPNLMHLLEVTLGVFAGGNVVSTVAGAFYGGKQEAGEAEPVPASPVEQPAETPDAVEPPANKAAVTLDTVYAGLAEVYQKIEGLEKATAEVSKSQAVAGKVLNMLLEKQ